MQRAPFREDREAPPGEWPDPRLEDGGACVERKRRLRLQLLEATGGEQLASALNSMGCDSLDDILTHLLACFRLWPASEVEEHKYESLYALALETGATSSLVVYVSLTVYQACRMSRNARRNESALADRRFLAQRCRDVVGSTGCLDRLTEAPRLA